MHTFGENSIHERSHIELKEFQPIIDTDSSSICGNHQIQQRSTHGEPTEVQQNVH